MYTQDTKKEQPPIRDSAETAPKRYHAGSQRSQTRLRDLNYDPIGELVRKYHELERLILVEMDYKSGALVKMSRSTGKEMNWYPDFLGKLLDQQTAIADRLLRYGYGRVPEININENRSLPPMLISTTKKGDIYHTTGDLSNDHDDF